MRVLSITILLVACASGCKPKANPSRVFNLENVPPHQLQDAPPVGRSLFDHLMVKENAGKLVFDIPYPFEALVKRIEEKTQGKPLVTLIPKGRSLQRSSSSFQFPRVVLAVTGEPKQTAEDLGIYLKDRLYLGFVESSKLIEIISYNDEAARFEYQVIKAYGPAPNQPQLLYASRRLCLSCHQNLSPIFSQFAWEETNSQEQIAKLIADAQKSDSYLGFPVRIGRDASYQIDQSTDRANYLIPYNELWVKACGNDAPNAPTCRKLTLRFALEYRFTNNLSLNSPEHEQLQTLWSKFWGDNFASGLAFISPDIPNRNPFTVDSGEKLDPHFDGLNDTDKDTLNKLLGESSIPADLEPLTPRAPSPDSCGGIVTPTQFPSCRWTFDKQDAYKLIYGLASFFTDADIAQLKQLTGGDFTKIAIILDQMMIEDEASFGGKPFQRSLFMAAFVKRLSGQDVNTCCQATPAMPPVVLETEATEQQPLANEDLKLFMTYCKTCHAAGALNFLEGKEEEILTKLKADGRQHIARITWEDNPTSPMPPKGSDEQKALAANETAAASNPQKKSDRTRMINFLKKLTSN